MGTRTTIAAILSLSALAACQTPAPKPETNNASDSPAVTEVEPTSQPAPAPEPEPELKPEPKLEQKPPAKPETYVAKPEVPEGLGFGEQALIRMAERVRGGLSFSPTLGGEACGNSVGATAYASPQGRGNMVDDCPRVVAGAHALTYVRVVTKLGVLDASSVALVHDGDIIWSAIDTCEGIKIAENACPSDFKARRATALSFVGPELAYHISTQVAEAGGPPTSANVAHVLDVRTKQPARPYALLDSDSLRNELKRNLTLRKILNPVELDAAKSVDEIWKLWRTQDFAFFGAYYYAGWDAKAGVVDLRVWYLEDSAEKDPNDLKELQVWVRPKQQWRSAFEEAASEASGFLAQ